MFKCSLYDDCEYIECGYLNEDVNIPIYAPSNELDFELFDRLISNELLKAENIKIFYEFYSGINTFDRFQIGNMLIRDPSDDNNQYVYCTFCNLIIPVDMEYYQNDSCNLCKICSDSKNVSQFNKKYLSSSVNNINDWVIIFSIKHVYIDDIYDNTEEYYCNLNKNSPLYGKFGTSLYVEMLGNTFQLIQETSINEIIEKYHNIDNNIDDY